ncbi:hypothetical protein BRD01_05530 [Halobacteriales archaeon QS_8_65_32]|nr:MAG: hypothetical protein BRD01_05530 [Halobacteriales archaeon QS_8_65_32]
MELSPGRSPDRRRLPLNPTRPTGRSDRPTRGDRRTDRSDAKPGRRSGSTRNRPAVPTGGVQWSVRRSIDRSGEGR